MTSLSAIALEAYKKYILVSLIHFGQVAILPKYASSVAQRTIKNFAQAYVELTTSYATGKISELESVVQANREKFESDSNLGLVKQVVSSMVKRNIQRLTQTSLTLSLQDIANKVSLRNPKEAEMHVLQMIRDGEIYATINQKDGMVRFLKDPEQDKTCHMIEHMDSSIQRRMAVSSSTTAIDEHMEHMPDWSSVHADLFGIVARSLTVLEDFMSFRGVCSSWRAVATKDKYVSVSKVPFLMLAEKESTNECEFYSLAKRKICTRIPLPDLMGKRCNDVGFGWILTKADDGMC